MKFGPLIRRVWRNDKRWRAWIECDVTLNEFITVINEVHSAFRAVNESSRVEHIKFEFSL